MKIALCFSGQPRNYEQGYEAQRWLVEEYGADVFFHTVLDESGYKANTINKIYPYDPEIVEKIVALYNPKTYYVDTAFDYNTNRCSNSGYPLQATLSMYNSIYRSIYLAMHDAYSLNFQYDVIIRTRFDLDVKFHPENLLEDHINVFEWEYKHLQRYGVNDQFAVGNTRNMKLYSEVYIHLLDYLDSKPYIDFLEFPKHQENRLKNEYLLKYHLNRNDVPINIITNGHIKIIR